MNLLNRYLLGQFVKYFFTVNAGFVAIWLLVDFFEKFDDFNNAGKPLSLALKYFLLTIPAIVDQISPVLILLSGVITLGILNHSNELTALKAGGIPIARIIRPIIAGSVVFTLLFVAAAEWLMPYSVSQTNNIWYQQLKGKVPLGIMRNNRYYYQGSEGFYSFGWDDRTKQQFSEFSLSRWDENYNLHQLITADVAAYDETHQQWVLKHGQVQEQQGETYRITNFRKEIFHFPEQPDDFLMPINKTAEQSLTELYLETVLAKFEREREAAWNTFLSRISYILLGIPLLLLGMPILLIAYRRWGRDLSVAIPASCGLAFLAWGIWGALQSLASAGYVSPIVAACSIHIAFSLAGVILLVKSDQ